MANQSKLVPSICSSFFDSLPYTCYECAHTWEPSCVKAWYDTLRDSMKFSVKVYVGFYMLSLMLRIRKKENRNLQTLKKLLLDILQSSVFLSMNGTLFLAAFCIFRQMLGKLYIWNGFIAGTAGGYLAIHFERKSRRGLLALYLANLATETLFNMAISRNLIRSIPNGEVFLFMLASAGFMALYRTPHGLSEHLQGPLDYFVGGFEKPQVTCESQRSAAAQQPSKSALLANLYAILKPLDYRLKKLHPHHKFCKHPHSCLHYIATGFLKIFLVGYGAQVLLNSLQMFRGRQNVSSFVQSFVKLKTSSLGLFVGLYNALFRLCNCFLRWTTNEDHSTSFGALSGAVAGIASYFYKSSTISMYFLFKLIEVLAGKAISKGWLPNWENANTIIYAISLGVCLQAGCIEPHHIRPGYWKFLIGVSGNQFPFMFRKLLDEFGTDATKLYPNFVPNLNPTYVTNSRAMEILLDAGKKGVVK